MLRIASLEQVVVPRELDRGLDRLGAARVEAGVIERSRRMPDDLLCELLSQRMPELRAVHVGEHTRLLGDGIGDLGHAVSDAHDRDRTRAGVDVLAPLAVPDPDTVAPHGLRQLASQILLEPGRCGDRFSHRTPDTIELAGCG